MEVTGHVSSSIDISQLNSIGFGAKRIRKMKEQKDSRMTPNCLFLCEC